jgi:mRNA interferase RelE/StbE
LAWTIEYTDSARRQLQKLDKPVTRRILDLLDYRAAQHHDPRSLGKALTGPLGTLWRYQIGDSCVNCEIQNVAVRILVTQIGHRPEVHG